MLQLNVYKNNDANSENYGKAYARVDYKEELDIAGLAKHMSEHHTPFSEGAIAGILTDMVSCIRELCLTGITVKIPNLAIFKCSVQGNACSRYAIMRAAIGAKTAKVDGQTVETGNAVKNVKLLAYSTGAFSRGELNKVVQLGWTTKAQDLINADKEAMAQAAGGNG